MYKIYFVNYEGWDLMDEYNTYDEAMADAEKYGWIDDQDLYEEAYYLTYPDGTNEPL